MFKTVSDCCGCDHCINCGRKAYQGVFCDGCNTQLQDKAFLYGYNHHYCEDCVREEIVKDEGCKDLRILMSKEIEEEYDGDEVDDMTLAEDFFEELCEYFGIDEVSVNELI